MNELLLGLLLWITQNTGLSYDNKSGQPEIKTVEQQQLAVLLFKGNIPAYLSPNDLREITGHIEAIYHPETKTIYVRKDLDLDSVYGKSTLVHELVHFLQYQHGLDRKVACVNALEKEAYRVQAVYLRQRGQEPNFDDFTALARSMC